MKSALDTSSAPFNFLKCQPLLFLLVQPLVHLCQIWKERSLHSPRGWRAVGRCVRTGSLVSRLNHIGCCSLYCPNDCRIIPFSMKFLSSSLACSVRVKITWLMASAVHVGEVEDLWCKGNSLWLQVHLKTPLLKQ